MRHFLIALAILMSSCCYSEESKTWMDHWCKAIECCAADDLTEGVTHFSSALDQLRHPGVYVDRGHAYLLLNKYEEALADFNKAMHSVELAGSDHLRCIEGRICAYAYLGRDSEWLQEIEAYKQFCPTYPQIEFSQDKIIMRNVPDCKVFQALVTTFLLKSKIIESEDAIKKYPSKVWMIHIQPSTPCMQDFIAQDRFQDELDRLRACQNWCERFAGSGVTWCQVFNTTQCQAACVFTVDVLRNQCRSCCARGIDFRQCVIPFEDISQAMINQGFSCNADAD